MLNIYENLVINPIDLRQSLNSFIDQTTAFNTIMMNKLDSHRRHIVQATLTLIAVYFHYTSYLMASTQATQKKKWAKWTQADERTFLEFLVEHHSKADHGQFKGHTLQKAIPVLDDKYDKVQLMSKWGNVSIQVNSKLIKLTSSHIQLKSIYMAIEGYRGLSGVHWDNEKGARIDPASASSVQVFNTYCATSVMIIRLPIPLQYQY